MRAQLLSLQNQTGRVHPMLANAPGLPRGTEGLWSDFLALHVSRGSTGFGAARITYADIDVFERVNEIKFDAWEIEGIRGADRAWFDAQASK